MCQAQHGLSRRDDLARFRQRLHDDAVAIGQQHRIAAGVAGDIGLGLGRAELGLRGIGRRLDLVIRGHGDGAGAAQIAIARLVLGGLPGPRPRRRHRLLLRMGGQLQVLGIDAHQRLAALDGLSGVHQPLQHLAGNAETQIALDPSADGAGERPGRGRRGLHRGHAHQRRLGAGICDGLLATGREQDRQAEKKRGNGKATPAHESPNDE